MRRPIVSMAIMAAVAVATLHGADARAQSYGPEKQVLTIGAAEFQPRLPPSISILSDGYRYLAGNDLYLAPVSLPQGAFITEICLYAFDSETDRYLETYLIAVRLVPGGESPGVAVLGVDVSSYGPGVFGYEVFCEQPQGGNTLRGKLDVDGDGSPDEVAYYLAAWLPEQGGVFNTLGLGGVRITWQRQVSPPAGTPTFGDVPGTDPAFPYIEALAASGITAGCAGGNYCPNTALTRRQMAVFLSKALGLHWPD